MGGSRPSPPTVYMPAPSAARLYRSVVPEADYGDLAERLKRIQQQTDTALGQRYQEVGTPAEIGARQAGSRVEENAAYLSALPSGDKYLSEMTGTAGKYEPVKQAAEQQLTDSQKQYAEALSKAGDRPASTVTSKPAWGIARREPPAPTPATTPKKPSSTPAPAKPGSLASFADVVKYWLSSKYRNPST